MHERPAGVKELVPAGKLRIAVAVGPAGSPFWATNDALGRPHGVAVDIGTHLAERLGVAAEILPYASSGEIMDRVDSGDWDLALIPVDEERKRKVDFTTNYALGESTVMVGAGVPIASLAEVDRPGVKVVGVENTTTIRAARRTLKQAVVIGARGAGDTLDLLRSGEVDAIALGRDTLETFAAQIPGARVLDGYFWAVGVAIAVPKNKPAGLAAVLTDLLESAKSDGSVRQAFDRAGLPDVPVAPAGSRS